MIYFFTGTDREKARAAMNADIERAAKKMHGDVIRITDAHTIDDLRVALLGKGMFENARVLVLEGILANEDMLPLVMERLVFLAENEDTVFFYEEKPTADIRRKIERHAEKSVRFDAPKKDRDNSIFSLPNALACGDKKALWVEYQRALARGDAPEAIHGVLFWGAKRMYSGSTARGTTHARNMIIELAELPHEARRHGIELEYALERYILTVNKG